LLETVTRDEPAVCDVHVKGIDHFVHEKRDVAAIPEQP
jgi:hypothetical protein